MNKNVDVGLFIPVGKNGWIHSVNTPYTPGSFKHVLEVTQRAEKLGFDFVLSPAIWRGRKGPSKHWMRSLESLTATAGLLQGTSRIKVWSTAHMTVFPPPTVAKMVATLDDIGPGRVGLNLVTGSSLLDLEHIGLWDDTLDHDARYRLGDEWIRLVKRFWTEDAVTHSGEFYYAKEGHMGPKPSQMPTLLNAGISDRGLRFAVENCDWAFMGGGDNPAANASARRAKEIAQSFNKPNFKTLGLMTLVPGSTDADAQAAVDLYDAGLDEIAMMDAVAGYRDPEKGKAWAKHLTDPTAKPSAVGPNAMIGSYETLARRLAKAITEGDLDGVALIVPDYIKDVEAVATQLLPLMTQYGVTSQVGRQNQTGSSIDHGRQGAWISSH